MINLAGPSARFLAAAKRRSKEWWGFSKAKSWNKVIRLSSREQKACIYLYIYVYMYIYIYPFEGTFEDDAFPCFFSGPDICYQGR